MNQIRENSHFADFTCSYTSDLAVLVNTQADQRRLDASSSGEYLDAVRGFSKRHSAIQKKQEWPEFNDYSFLIKTDVKDIFNKNVQLLVTHVGEPTFKEHIGDCVTTTVAKVNAARPELSIVHASVIETHCEVHEIMPMLIMKPALLELAQTTVASDHDYQKWKDGLEHNEALQLVSEVCDNCELEEIRVPGVFHVSDPSAAPPVEIAKVMLKTIAISKDVAILGAHLHFELLSKFDGESKLAITVRFSNEDCFKKIPNLIRMYSTAMQQLDSIVEGSTFIDVDKLGWKSEPSVSLLLPWKGTMALAGGRARDALLKIWALQVDAAREANSKGLPDWRAAFSRDRMDRDLLFSECQNKVDMVAKRNNAMFDVLKKVRECAVTLEITVPVQRHEITSKSIALCKSAMNQCMISTLICEGADILASPSSIAKADWAKDFVANKKPSASLEIPQQFWHELERESEHAGITVNSDIESRTNGKGKLKELRDGVASTQFKRMKTKSEADVPLTPNQAIVPLSLPDVSNSTEERESQHSKAKRVKVARKEV